MGGHSEWLRAVEDFGVHFAEQGLVLRRAEDERLDGRTVTMEGRPRINFGSCSYFGLELDPRLVRGAVDAVERYGTQFSCSRIYLSSPLYEELETLLDRIFGGPTVLAPNTTLAHLSALPVLVGERDAVVMDHQVHTTVRLAVQSLRVQGAHVEVLPHSDVQTLEERVAALARTHERVWYLCDGVYSMHGDLAPVETLAALLERHEAFHLYVDDAHGMGWCGEHGRGHTLSAIPGHPRLVVATSLAKCFGVVGGVLVLPDEAARRRLRLCGGPMLFTGPIQPGNLGAAIASARIHLSPELGALQARLRERMRLFNGLAAERGLPIASSGESPMRFVAAGPPGAAADLVERVFQAGFWTNLATFPAVQAKQSGMRCALTLHQRESDVRALVDRAALELPGVLARAGLDERDVRRYFALPERSAEAPPAAPPEAGSRLVLQHARSFRDLDAAEWARCFGEGSVFAGDTLRCLEDAFRDGERPEDLWELHYLIVRDPAGRPLAATAFTSVLWKDDVFEPAEVSRRVEELRRGDPYFLTSRVLLMGSPLTEGAHLFLDRSGDWREALRVLIRAATEIAAESGAQTLVLRDLPAGDAELALALREHGFAASALPQSFAVDVDWRDDAEFLARLSKKSRRFQRHEVLPWEAHYEIEVLPAGAGGLSDADWRHLHGLYRNVWKRSLALNTFPIPESGFRALAAWPGWELVLFRLATGAGGSGRRADAFLLAHAAAGEYTPLVFGLDYELVRTHGLYRRCMLEVLRRARAHGAERIHFGMGAEREKRRFGAQPLARVAFVRSDDHLHADRLQQIAAEVACERKADGQASAEASSSERTRRARAAGVKGLRRKSEDGSSESVRPSSG